MHSYTLNNWDGSQSQGEAGSGAIRNSKHSLKHTLSPEHDQSMFKPTSGMLSTNDVERANDASYGTQEVGLHDWIMSEELESKGRKMVCQDALLTRYSF